MSWLSGKEAILFSRTNTSLLAHTTITLVSVHLAPLIQFAMELTTTVQEQLPF